MNLTMLLKKSLLIDGFVIIIMVTYHLSVIDSFIFDSLPIDSLVCIFAFIFTAHLLRFGFHFSFVNKFKRKGVLYLYFLCFIVDSIQLLFFRGFFSSAGVLVRLFTMFFFISYISNVYYEQGRNLIAIRYIQKPMLFYSTYNIFVIICMFVLIMAGVNYQQNIINTQLFQGHDEWNMNHYFPFFLCIVANFHDIFPIPTLLGLSHESHVLMFLITSPLLFFCEKKNVLFYCIALGFFFVLIESTSTTAILCFLFILGIEILWSFFNKKNLKNLILFAIILLILSMQLVFVLDIAQAQVILKLQGEDSSGETSLTMLNYLFSFGELFGTGNVPSVYGLDLKGSHAGAITGFLDLLLYVNMIILAFRCFMSKDLNIHYCGLGFIYFLLHMVKVNYLVFSYPYFAYIIFLLCVLNNDFLARKKEYNRFNEN